MKNLLRLIQEQNDTWGKVTEMAFHPETWEGIASYAKRAGMETVAPGEQSMAGIRIVTDTSVPLYSAQIRTNILIRSLGDGLKPIKDNREPELKTLCLNWAKKVLGGS